MHRSINSGQLSCQVIDWGWNSPPTPMRVSSVLCMCCCTWLVWRSCDKSSALYMSHACQGLCRSQRGKHPSILPASLVSCHPYANTIPGDAWSPSSVPFCCFFYYYYYYFWHKTLFHLTYSELVLPAYWSLATHTHTSTPVFVPGVSVNDRIAPFNPPTTTLHFETEMVCRCWYLLSEGRR